MSPSVSGAELGLGLFCPARLKKAYLAPVVPQPLAEWALPMPLPGGPVWVPALVALAEGTQMTQAWGLETGILIPAWLWGPGLLQPAPNVGCYKAAAQPPPHAALLRSPGVGRNRRQRIWQTGPNGREPQCLRFLEPQNIGNRTSQNFKKSASQNPKNQENNLLEP